MGRSGMTPVEVSPGAGGKQQQAVEAQGASCTRSVLVSVSIITEAKSSSFEHVSSLGSTEDLVGNERWGIRTSAEARGAAGSSGWERWLTVAARRRFDTDSNLRSFPQHDLVREEPLIGKRAVKGIASGSGARGERLGRISPAAADHGTGGHVGAKGAHGRRKEVLRRRVLMRVTVVIMQRLHLTPRGLRVIEVVARPRVAGLANPDPRERAVTGGGKAEGEAGA